MAVFLAYTMLDKKGRYILIPNFAKQFSVLNWKEE